MIIIDKFFRESYKQLQAKDPDMLFINRTGSLISWSPINPFMTRRMLRIRGQSSVI
ncbi:MAG: hypothetical protein HXS45_11635 [Theionarchaea archaeon]|nr:hypothetical protein [Theionarchaea archaeon]